MPEGPSCRRSLAIDFVNFETDPDGDTFRVAPRGSPSGTGPLSTDRGKQIVGDGLKTSARLSGHSVR